MNGWMPTMFQAGDYCRQLHCLKAMAALGIAEAQGERPCPYSG